jgi:pimeloyl-ACP methyl ester carboxylesterase
MVGASHGALLTALEHRFYGESQPFDDLSTENLGYLSAEQALSDIAHFLNYLNGGKSYRPVIVVGGSYPGALSAWFRSRYPHLSVGSWSSSGVVYPIQDFWTFDFQIFASTKKSGYTCSTSIQKLMYEVFEEPKNNLTEIKISSGASPDINDGDFAFYFSDIFVESVQYGNRTGLCNLMSEIEGKPLQEQLQAISAHAELAGVAPGDYDRRAIKNTTITDSAARAWTYQYCT